MEPKINWSDYYDHAKNQKPHTLLVKALDYVSEGGNVLELGGGTLRDTKLIIEKGYHVTVVDSCPLMAQMATEFNSNQLKTVQTKFEDYSFPKDEYVLVSAMYSLSYCEPEKFNELIKNIKLSLKKEGIFCGQMIDGYDDWSKTLNRSYQNLDQIKEYFKDMEIILLEEESIEEERTKHWRTFNFIVKR